MIVLCCLHRRGMQQGNMMMSIHVFVSGGTNEKDVVAVSLLILLQFLICSCVMFENG